MTEPEKTSRAFWFFTLITGLSAIVSASFSVAGLLGHPSRPASDPVQTLPACSLHDSAAAGCSPPSLRVLFPEH
jgi:hypothetical protein